MTVSFDPADRARGLVYLDAALAARPATHVLVSGTGRFDRQVGPPFVSSPTVSARRITDWFPQAVLTRGPGFRNDSRPLGSLAASLRVQPPLAFKTLPDPDAMTDQRNRPVVMERAGRSPTAELTLSGGAGRLAWRA